jgi:hypothetical protein
LNPREVQLFLAGQALPHIYTPKPAIFHEKSGLAVKGFLQATLGPGQVDLDKNGYIPLPPDFQSRVSGAIDAIA